MPPEYVFTRRSAESAILCRAQKYNPPSPGLAFTPQAKASSISTRVYKYCQFFLI